MEIIQIVIVPDYQGPNVEVSRILRESLKKYGLSILILTGE